MTKFEKASALTRRSVLLGGGALVVSIGAGVTLDTVLSIGQAFAQGAKPPLTPDQLSSYIAVNADGSVSAFFGKMDMGHGLHVRSPRSWRKSSTFPSRASGFSWATPPTR